MEGAWALRMLRVEISYADTQDVLLDNGFIWRQVAAE